MRPNFRTILRFATVALLAGILPLRAQLDPRLQTSKTDFLDLFQQSTSFKVKPEILTIFDYSGSMQALMYHPEFNNTDVSDGNASSNMIFWLTGAAGSRVPHAELNFGGAAPFGKLTSTTFVRPDGSILTEANINANYVNIGLYGEAASPKASDIRNWVRCASHVRFTTTVGSDTRTVDVPLAWKIMASTSTGYPLSSYTTLDQTTVTNPDGSTTTYGTGTQIEMDRLYLIQNNTGNNVLSGTAAVIPTGDGSTTTGSATYRCTLQQIDYKQFYLQWLMNGKYAAGAAYAAGKYIVFDAANASLVGGQGNVNWGKGFGTFSGSDTILSTTAGGASVPASSYALPARNRVQAVKEASIRTWIKYQKSVFWAYRFLDQSGEAGGGSANNINNNSRTNLSGTDPTTSFLLGSDSGWRTLNSDSLGGMKRIASHFPGNSTPLTYAMARGLAQFADPNSVFNDVETGTDAPVQCQYRFLILFTDGIDNNGTGTNNTNAASPYLTRASAGSSAAGTVAGSLDEGNAKLLANPTNINRSGPWWNLFTFAGIAAHLADDTDLANRPYVKNTDVTPNVAMPGPTFMLPPGSFPGSSQVPSSFLPFCVPSRGSVTYKAPHRLVTTMSVGVSLGGTYSNTAGPKYRLFAAACIGDPTRKKWDLNTLTPFTLVDPNDPTQGPTSSSVYFFDATNPDLLTKSLDYAVLEAGKKSNINVTNSPTLPYIGATFGKQIYIGKFQPPKTGGTIWDGDLLAFSTRETATGIDIMASTGIPTTDLSAANAIWSAKTELKARLWTGRKLFTRIPGTMATPEPGLTTFSDLGYPSSAPFSTISPFVATTWTAAQKRQVIQFAAGGDTAGTLDGSGRPTANRDSIMGDVINSSPVAVEYGWNTTGSGGPWFETSLPTTIQGTGNRFRLILVGTNQGWLHAFGEKSTVLHNVGPSNVDVVQASIAELWSFLPTDFLKNLNYIYQTNNPHRFLVDGSPTIYHLDMPSPGGAPVDGIVNNAGATATSIFDSERATVIFGLRKGGRSYYAIDIRNPTAPVLKWSLVPDEADYFPASRIASGGPALATVVSILKKMGFSTATPSIGRVQFTQGGSKILKDVVFFSGGLSLPEIESNFLDGSGNPMKLGRSVLALDVDNGQVLAAVDMATIDASIPSIPAGLVPFEFFLNSGMAQRTYFLDAGGGLWAWGSRKTLSTAPYVDYRQDSSDLAEWTDTGIAGGSPGIRKVAQDGSGNSAKYSTLPAPFRVGAFPGKPKPSQAPPAAVGVAMVSGDRNNPLDYFYTSGTRPTAHRATVVFDRQDSKAWGLDTSGILDTNLQNFTGQNNPSAGVIDPTNASYYLAPGSGNPWFGYYVNYPAATGTFVTKGITEPMVVAGSLFYTYFNPSEADPCSGGEGISHSLRICDVINPIVNDPRSGLGCTSGEVYLYAGVSTSYVAYGTRGVIQSGVTSGGAGAAGGSSTTPVLNRFTGRQQERFPKPRVWRTVR